MSTKKISIKKSNASFLLQLYFITSTVIITTLWLGSWINIDINATFIKQEVKLGFFNIISMILEIEKKDAVYSMISEKIDIRTIISEIILAVFFLLEIISLLQVIYAAIKKDIRKGIFWIKIASIINIIIVMIFFAFIILVNAILKQLGELVSVFEIHLGTSLYILFILSILELLLTSIYNFMSRKK